VRNHVKENDTFLPLPTIIGDSVMKKLALFLIACLILSSVGVAQPTASQPKVLTLDNAISAALERNISIQQAYANTSSAQSGVLAAYGTYLPTVSASGSWTRQQTNRPASTQLIGGQPILVPAASSTTNNYSTGLSAGYTIFNGFSREAGYSQAVSSAVSAEQQSIRTNQQIVYEVQSAYLAVLRNQQLVKVSQENLARDQKQLERITESNRVGALSIGDVYRQQSQVSQDEVLLITAQNTYDNSIADLVSLVGLDVADNYQIADPKLPTELSTADFDAVNVKVKSFDELRQHAMAARPDYISAKELYSAAQSGVTSASSPYYPSVSAFAAYNLSNTDFAQLSQSKGINWGLSIRWSIFDGFQTNRGIQAAIAQRRSAELNLLQTERNVSVDVKKALLAVDAAKKQYDASLEGLTSATQDRRVAEEKYNLGSGTLVDLLTANAGLVNAQANKVNATYNYITSSLNLDYVIGEKKY
jgi:outer membrane protein